jgi:hypothetical protein
MTSVRTFGRIWFFAGALIASLSAHADSAQVLIEVSSDVDADHGAFILDLDAQGDIARATYRGEKGRSLNLMSFTLPELMAGATLVHNGFPSADVVRIRAARDFGPQQGGEVDILFLPSVFAPSSYVTKPIRIVRSGAYWEAYAEGSAFRQMRFLGNHGAFGAVIGVGDFTTWW